MVEHRSEPLVSGQHFALRLLSAFALSAFLVIVSVAIGFLGYGVLGEKPWDAAFHKNCLILSGHEVEMDESRNKEQIFAGLWQACLSLALGFILVKPVAHRILPKLQLENERR